MISFPNGKINIGLTVLDKREDGFHNIESIFYPVNWLDALEIISSSKFNFQTSGIEINGPGENNLCVKAYRFLQQEFDLPPINIYLLKNIPLGAGLGGGSSDAAFLLKMMNEFFELKLPHEKLLQLSGSIGSDCAFFVDNKPSLVSGKGEVQQPVDLSLAGYFVVLVYPGIQVDTSTAYRKLDLQRSEKIQHETFPSSIALAEIIKQPIASWKEQVLNEFEPIIFTDFPKLAVLKDQLYQSGALYASLSGSGSTIYGIYKEKPTLPYFPPDYLVFSGVLR
jgi:4-diphosphocytidyl-2-C-methyl-D-erythritol kinase